MLVVYKIFFVRYELKVSDWTKSLPHFVSFDACDKQDLNMVHFCHKIVVEYLDNSNNTKNLMR